MVTVAYVTMENRKIIQALYVVNRTQQNIYFCVKEINQTHSHQKYIRNYNKKDTTEKMKLKQIACDIQQVIEDRKKLQEVISRTG